MKILFFAPYPFDQAPSQRFRFEQYFASLEKNAIQHDLKSFFSSQNWKKFNQSENPLSKAFILFLCFVNRLLSVVSSRHYDYIFIHRELAPIGPPIFEWIIFKVFRKKIIYDFDDAIWLTDKVNESRIERIMRWRSKTSSICKWSYKVSCGNDYLAGYALQFNSNVIVNPTTIDLEKIDPIIKKLQPNEKDEIVIGWTGSHSTLKYLEQLEDVLQQIELRFPKVVFMVIADRPPQINLNRLQFVKWNKNDEIKDLMAISIGIMPLPSDEWTKGKCGFKALQYMSLGIPSIVSPVGVNTKIITHNFNGMLCATGQEWINAVSELIHNPIKRTTIGCAGRKIVEESYSVASNELNFLALFS